MALILIDSKRSGIKARALHSQDPKRITKQVDSNSTST
jgi:hypothetical protein